MRAAFVTSVLLCALAISGTAIAQPPSGAPLPAPQAPPPGAPLPPPIANAPAPQYPPAELERIVSPIALYPDPLLAQVLAAATFWQDVPAAAQWADQHHYLTGPALAAAIQADQVPWDPSVQALLPFPSVLGMMASAMPWTQEIGGAFLAQQPELMAAVQVQRQKAAQFGYLQTNAQVVVVPGPYIAIQPVNPAYVVVPYYDPRIVYVAPRPGFQVVTAVRFGYGVTVGVAFASWGWGYTHVDWTSHVVYINHDPWHRTWVNRATYVHPYAIRRPVVGAHTTEAHRLVEQSEHEKQAAREGRKVEEEHKHEEEKKKGRQ